MPHKIWTAALSGIEAVLVEAEADAGSGRLLRAAGEKMALSARGYWRGLKLARTISDLADSERILDEHLAEALQYRPRVE